MAEPLRLLNTIKLALEQVWESRAAIILVVVIAAAIKSTTTWIAYDFMEPTHGALLHKTINLVVYTALAISVHRLLLNAEQPALRYWRMREVRFMGWVLFLVVIFTLIFAVLGGFISKLGGAQFELFKGDWTATLVFLLISIPGAYICARFSMLLPATALDRKPKLAWAWALTKGSGLKLTVLLWIIPFVFPYLYADWETDTPLYYLAVNVVVSMFTALEIALLSVAFKTLGGMSFKTPSDVQAQPL